MDLDTGHTEKLYKIILLITNLVIMTLGIIASVFYAHNIRASQLQTKERDFISTVESMKSVSQNYLDSERGYVVNWAAYIN